MASNNAGETQRIIHVHEGPTVFGPGAGFTILMNCDGNYGPGCAAGPTVAAHYFAATEVDPLAPSLSPPGGSAVGGGVLRGHQTLAAEAADKGGGLSQLEVLVNGAPAVTKSLACATTRADNPSVKGVVALSVTPAQPQRLRNGVSTPKCRRSVKARIRSRSAP